MPPRKPLPPAPLLLAAVLLLVATAAISQLTSPSSSIVATGASRIDLVIEKQDYFEAYFSVSTERINATAWNVTLTLNPRLRSDLADCYANLTDANPLSLCDFQGLRSTWLSSYNITIVDLIQDIGSLRTMPTSNLTQRSRVSVSSLDYTSAGALTFEVELGSVGQSVQVGRRTLIFNGTDGTSRLNSAGISANGTLFAVHTDVTNTVHINKSADNGSTWSGVTLFTGATKTAASAVDQVNLLHIIYPTSANVMKARHFNITNNSLSGANSVADSQCDVASFPMARRNGNISLLCNDNSFLTLGLFESANRGYAWANPMNFTQRDTCGGTYCYDFTETPDGSLHVFKIGLGNRNVTYINVSPTYAESAPLRIFQSGTGGSVDEVSVTSSPNGTVFAVYTELVPAQNVLWMTKVDNVTKAHTTYVIANYSDINVSEPHIVADSATGNLYVIFGNRTFASAGSYCYVINSTTGGSTWGPRINVSLDRCSRASAAGKYPWLPSGLNSSLRAFLDFTTHNGSTGQEFRYGNISIAEPSTNPSISNVTATLTSASAVILGVSASDPNGLGDLSSCFLGSTSNGTFSSGFCTLSLNASVAGLAWINDSAGLNASRTVNYTYAIENEDQDSSRISEAGSVAFTLFRLNASFSGINETLFSLCRSSWTANASSATVNLSNYQLGCNSTTALTKARARYNVSGQVVVGENVTGFMEVLVNNTDGLITYASVLVNRSTGSLVPGGWQLNDSDTYLLNLTNGTQTLNNATIRTTVAYVSFLAPQAADCTGFTIFASYCTMDTAEDLGSGRTRHTTTVRHLINSTNASARTFEVVVPMPLSRFTNWASRNPGSESGTVNGSATNLSVSSDASNVNLTVGTSHSTSSISPGAYVVDVSYTWDTVVGQSPGGGSGGGGGAEPIVTFVLGTNRTFSISPVERSLFLKPGELAVCSPAGGKCKEFVIQNPTSDTFDVSLTLEQFLTDPSVGWAAFRTGENAVTQLSVFVPAGTIVNPGRGSFNLSVNVPLDAGLTNYQFYVVAKADRAPVVRVPVRTFLNEQPVVQGLLDVVGMAFGFIGWFVTSCCTLPRPIWSVTYVPAALVLAAFVAVWFTASVLRSAWINIRGRKPRSAH